MKHKYKQGSLISKAFLLVSLILLTLSSVQCYVTVWMGRQFGAERIHVHVWLSPST